MAKEKFEEVDWLLSTVHEREEQTRQAHDLSHASHFWEVLLERIEGAHGPRRPMQNIPVQGAEAQSVLDFVSTQEFRTAVSTMSRQWLSRAAAAIATQTDQPPLNRIEALEARVKELEERIGHLEMEPDLPRPLIEEGDPLELLRQLRDELGPERFGWFTEVD